MEKTSEYVERLYNNFKKNMPILIENLDAIIRTCIKTHNAYNENYGKLWCLSREQYVVSFESDSVRELFSRIFKTVDIDLMNEKIMETFCGRKYVNVADVIKIVEKYIYYKRIGLNKDVTQLLCDTYGIYASLYIENKWSCASDVNRFFASLLSESENKANQTLADATLLKIYKEYGEVSYKSLEAYQKETGLDVYMGNYGEGGFPEYAFDVLIFPLSFSLAHRMFNMPRIVSRIESQLESNDNLETFISNNGLEMNENDWAIFGKNFDGMFSNMKVKVSEKK